MTDLFGIKGGGGVREEVVDVEEEILLGVDFEVSGVSWGVEGAVIKGDIDEDGVVKGVTRV